MKKFFAFVAFFAFIFSFAFSSPQDGYYGNSFARLSYVKGDVFIKRVEDLGYEEGVVNLPLVEGDKLGTGEGRAEVHLGGRNYLRLNSSTQIDFVNMPERGEDSIKLHLLAGEVFLRINSSQREKEIEIHTPDASFYILEEGLYRIAVRENRESEFFVYQGTAEAAGEEDSVLIRTEERIAAASGYFQSEPSSFYPGYEDSFASWNQSRDALHNRVISRRYLPDELYAYEAELAYHGRWVYERPYGYVWIPVVYHHEWRPYFYGRWVWLPTPGWTWVSYEPWGWCVSHYGRWHWRSGLGWYWIPTRTWGPAWVHWHWGYDYVGWCPLSYYGYPVVVVNNRFYGRHYGRDYPLHSRALTVVHRKQLQAPRISKAALSRNQVTRLGKTSLSAKQPPVRPAVNRSSPQNSVAKRILERSHIRPVNRNYSSEKTRGVSARSRMYSSSTSYRRAVKSSSSTETTSHSVKRRKISSFQRDPGMNIRNRSSPSVQKRKISSRPSSRFSSPSQLGSKIKKYPSREKFSTSSRSKTIPSSYKSRLRSHSSSRLTSSPSFYRSRIQSPVKHYSSSRTHSSSKYRSPAGSIRRYPSSSLSASRFRSSTPSIRGWITSSRFKQRESSSNRSFRHKSYTPPSKSFSKTGSYSKNFSSSKLSTPSSRSSYKSSSRSRTSSSRSSSRRIKKK
ncbi:MAG: DUF6600 domain-containing protein [Candidatus Aminicenantes bacterium]